ncbi:Ekc/keops complex subunit tprkb, partial [Globisporangium splendens]
MAMAKHTFELFPGRTLHSAFYKDVKNSAALHKALLNQEFDAALVNASLLVDPFQVYAAASRVLLCETTTRLTTKSMHAELVFNLSGSRNVTESFRRFGVADDCTSLVLCVFDADDATLASLASLVEGTLTPFNELGQHLTPAGVKAIRKFYKIQDLELGSSTLVDAIVCRIATKSCNK